MSEKMITTKISASTLELLRKAVKISGQKQYFLIQKALETYITTHFDKRAWIEGSNFCYENEGEIKKAKITLSKSTN